VLSSWTLIHPLSSLFVAEEIKGEGARADCEYRNKHPYGSLLSSQANQQHKSHGCVDSGDGSAAKEDRQVRTQASFSFSFSFSLYLTYWEHWNDRKKYRKRVFLVTDAGCRTRNKEDVPAVLEQFNKMEAGLNVMLVFIAIYLRIQSDYSLHFNFFFLVVLTSVTKKTKMPVVDRRTSSSLQQRWRTRSLFASLRTRWRV